MGDYYYLIAQLPSLTLGVPPPLASVEFRSLCLALMDGADARLLDLCALKPREEALAASSVLIASWSAWERALERDLARLRAIRLKRDVLLEDGGIWPETAAVAKAAYSMDSPLEAELYLDTSRWAALDSFSGLDPFSREVVYAYCLKLLLAERRALFRVEAGKAEYAAIYASVMEAAPTNMQSGESK